MSLIIDFNTLEGPVFSGRNRGEGLRKFYALEDEDLHLDRVVQIIIPATIYSINSGFFLGLFGPSIVLLGKEQFEKKYMFETSLLFQERITYYISLVEQKKQLY